MKKIFILTGALVLLVVLVGSAALVAAAQPSANPASQAATTLEGPRWVLVSYADQNGKTAQALSNAEATAQFENGRMHGTGGCNNYNASYQAKDGKLTVGLAASTMMMCDPPIMDQEAAYFANLQAAATYTFAGDVLTIANAKGDTVLTFKATVPISLTDGTWVMTNYNNGKQAVINGLEGTRVTAIFSADGQVSGSAGCNSYHAPYKVNGNNIQIGAAATTRMMCPQPIMDQETQYLNAIQQAATYSIDGTQLQLRSADDALLALYVHEPTAPSQPAAPTQPAAPAAAPTQPAQPVVTATPAAAAQPAGPAAGILAGQDLKNTYVTVRPAADSAYQFITLHLNPNGNAEFVSDYGNGSPISETGTWQDNGDGSLTVTLTDLGENKLARPVVIKFKRDGTYLTAVEYDKALFGEQGLKFNQAADVARKAGVGLFTLDLAAGFPLDPTFVSVNGGGAVDASVLGQGCTGFINLNPVVTVHWTGSADMVRTFFYSEGDSTLVVLTPKGDVLCSDNANEELLDPVVEIKNPAPGTYRIWVGSKAAKQLIPGILALTTKPDVNLDTFDLSKLITRPLIPVVLPKPTGVETGTVQLAIRAALKNAPTLSTGTPLTATVTADGDVPLFQFPVTKTCAGLVSIQPSFAFTTTTGLKQMRVFFEGDADASLLVLGNGGQVVACNDDAKGGVNLNPLVELANPPAGGYVIYVGRLSLSQPVKGTLTVTDATNAGPALLAPAKK